MTKLCPSPFIAPWQNGLDGFWAEKDGPWVLRSLKSQLLKQKRQRQQQANIYTGLAILPVLRGLFGMVSENVTRSHQRL